MKIESQTAALLRGLKLAGVIVGVAILAVVLLGIVQGWDEPGEYGWPLMLAGVAAWVGGGSGMINPLRGTGQGYIPYAHMVEDIKQRNQRSSSLLLMTFVGLVLIGFGGLLTLIGG